VDLPFFNYHLKGKGTVDLPEVLAYATGSEEWHRFDAWPPAGAVPFSVFLADNGALVLDLPPASSDGFDEYVSDPANPVPYTQETKIRRTREFMVEDQRFAAEREDVLVYQTEPLTEDYTFAGPIDVELFVSTTGTDADFVVKLIDVFPDDEPEWQSPDEKYLDLPMAGYQMMVRGEVFRAKFRKSFETPEPLVPGEVTRIAFATPDILHTFRAGHRIMLQVQSSWFPLVDRNPQTFVDIYGASEDDFQPATHRVHWGGDQASRIQIGRLSTSVDPG
jgi:putative CocE/NonD family hydrolase